MKVSYTLRGWEQRTTSPNSLPLKVRPTSTGKALARAGHTVPTHEMLPQITPFKEETELGQVIRDLNSDSLEDSKMSGIDMRSRLHPIEVSGLLALDALISMRCMPKLALNFTRQKKRLSVSLKGLGRTEVVDIIRGQREHNTMQNPSSGFFSRLFKPGGGQQQ